MKFEAANHRLVLLRILFLEATSVHVGSRRLWRQEGESLLSFNREIFPLPLLRYNGVVFFRETVLPSAFAPMALPLSLPPSPSPPRGL